MTGYAAEVRQDVLIMGNGTSAGGTLGRVRINGDGRIHGSSDCMTFRCNGTAVVEGSMRSTNAKVNGQLSVDEHFEAEQLKVNGGMKVGGGSRMGQIHINGDLSVGHSLSAVKMTVNGTLQAGDEIDVEDLKIRGRVHAGGMLYGRDINIKLFGDFSRVSSITGQVISVSTSRLARMIGLPRVASLRAEHIEGDEIFLENTQADTVRGRRVIIGRGCVIGQVIYSDQLKIDKDAEIINIERY